MSDIHALLIGIDFYYPNVLPEGVYYPKLAGCVRDISHVESYLLNRAKVPAVNIVKLTASDTGADKPPEAAGQLATRANMIAKFRQVAAMAEPGDQVYIHYSGHGGRAKTIYPNQKGPDGLDEALVPHDIGLEGGQYLRDVELGHLLQEMVDKRLNVTIVLDSCHSGGATRGRGGPLDAVVRGSDQIDNAKRPVDTLVGTPATLFASWSQANDGARGAKPASGWLPEPIGYVLFAACRASESAYEYAFDGKERNGALTYWLLDSLANAGPGYSYELLNNRIAAKVHGQFELQTPTVQGEADRAIFGGDVIKPHFAVSVLEVQDQRVRVNAGEAQMIGIDDYFAIFPNEPGVDFSQTNKRLALVKVQEVKDVEAWTAIEKGSSSGPVSVGDLAVFVPGDNLRLQRKVGIVIEDAGLQQKIANVINQNGQKFVVVAKPQERLDFQVALGKTGQDYEIWDPAGAVILGVGSPMPVADGRSLSTLVNRLVHLAKFRNVQAIDMPDPAKGRMIEVTLTADAPDGAAVGGAQPTAAAAEIPTYRVGDKMTLHIKNIQQPGTGQIGQGVLNITVLTTDSDWSITQIYPTKYPFEPVEPGKSIELGLEADLPNGQNESTTIFMVFATARTTEFGWLQLPALDQPPAPRGALRGTEDALTLLLASMTDKSAFRSGVKVLSSPEDKKGGWVVNRVQIHVIQ